MRILVYFMIVLSFLGCGSGDDPNTPIDKEIPQFQITEPVENQTLSKGEYIELSGTLTDDVKLDKLIVTLVNQSTKAGNGIDDPWQPEAYCIDLDTKEKELKAYRLFDQAIPTDCLAGSYNLKLQLFDAVGNEAILNLLLTIQ